MSLDRCVTDLTDSGELDQSQADEILSAYEDARASLADDLGDDAAAALASKIVLDQMERAAIRRKFLTGKSIMARQKIDADLRSASPDGSITPDAAPAFFTDRNGIHFPNVDGRREAIQRRAFSMIGDILQRHHADPLGRLRNEAELKDVVRAVFGEKVESTSAKEMAEAWTGAAEMLRRRFNAAGGDVGKLRNGRGYLPQSHDWMKVREAGFENWRDTIKPLLDREAMIDERTGLPFSGASLESALSDVYDTIRSDGWFKRDAGGVGGRSVANRRSDPRFLVFKDADSWMTYHEAFGRGTPYGAMTGYIKGMARDIAAMERFGPNPNAGVKWLRDTVEKAAYTADDKGQAVKAVQSTLSRMDALWNEYNGLNQRPAREWLANVGKAVRSFETAKSLGSAIVSALPGDIATQYNAARLYKLPFTQIMGNQLKLLNPKNAEHRALAARMGLIYEGWINDAAGRLRALNDELAAGAMGRMAEGVLRVSGLTAWTDSGHAAFGMGVLGHIADVRGKAFADLDEGFREMLERGGIGSEGWDAIRSTPIRSENGADWIFAQDVADPELGDRLLSMIAREQKVAVQQADFETRAVMHDSIKKGTVLGETVLNSLLFKSFGISMLLTHGRRILEMSDWKKRAQYLTRFALVTTMAGAVSIQLREILKGRDPRPMDSPDFWVAASLQGGGWGMIGDLLNMVVEPRMSSWAKWIGGPVIDTLDNATRLVGAGVQKAKYEMGFSDKDGNVGGAASKIVANEMPGGNIWYLRLALQRMFSDQLAEALDPHYAKSWHMLEKRAQDIGTDYWWRPGETSPERVPDLANVAEETPRM